MDAVKPDIYVKGSKHTRGIEHDLRGTDLCEGIWRLHFLEHQEFGIAHFQVIYPCLNGVIVSLGRIVLRC